MKKIVFVLLVINVVWVNCEEELHLIDPKPGMCFNIYQADQPIFFEQNSKILHTDSAEFQKLPGVKNAKQRHFTSRLQRERKVPYNARKLHEEKGCEIIDVANDLYVEVYCYPLQSLGNTIFLKKMKAGKE
ncbi:hypothetical protein NQ317_012156 [Molorchus minor]|uniref:Uncharacterized protein n=1 Tax=Molorchus minor TaxID=1323400 RepID=A0ABQ9K2S3_9CUCU|nr:hypothetical protein NQ317_012156 [Molorchus minor]